jgi:antitoxin (DNA-binding transcriptional repressor) of toxin-antitoxin stability system
MSKTNSLVVAAAEARRSLACPGRYSYSSYMRTVSVSWAKNNLSALLREIGGGATIVITDRGVPVARLAPPAPARGVPPSALLLAQRGWLKLPDQESSEDAVRMPPRPRLKRGASAVTALLAERESGW